MTKIKITGTNRGTDKTIEVELIRTAANGLSVIRWTDGRIATFTGSKVYRWNSQRFITLMTDCDMNDIEIEIHKNFKRLENMLIPFIKNFY